MKSIATDTSDFSLPTAEELEVLFQEGKMERIGMGSRRACYALPGGKLCVKCYRSDAEIEEGLYNGTKKLSSSVVREIKQARFDEKRNTSCQEYRYWKKLSKELPVELFSVFPQIMKCLFVTSRGWCVVEELVMNFDGSKLENFSQVYRNCNAEIKDRLFLMLKSLVIAFYHYNIRFYDPQNLAVQCLGSCQFGLRIVDFEPVSRSFIPIDLIFPFLIRLKTARRVNRWMRRCLGVDEKSLPQKKNWIPHKLRVYWDKIISTEGAALGLTECRSFLENKMVNDIFYEGLYKGVPCVVKCSSKAPDSILNEYELLNRLYSINSDVFPKPMAHFCSQDGRFAFVVTEKLNQAKGITSDSAAQDILAIALALKESGIVHRDIFVDNLMLGSNGHLKLIDFQFAIDRNDYRESVFMLRNPTYHYVTFGGEGKLGLGRWNDLSGFGLIRCLDFFAPNAKDIRERLVGMEREMLFEEDISVSVRRRLWWHEKSLEFRLLFNKKESLRWRYQKLKSLLAL